MAKSKEVLRYDGYSALSPETILGLGRFGQLKVKVIKDLGDNLLLKPNMKNWNETPFERPKKEYKGAIISF